MTLVAGVDGCRGGWLSVKREVGTGVVGVEVYKDAESLFWQRSDPAVIAIDIPIGLTEAGPRGCDIEARKLLGRRWPSVFPVLIRAALEAETRAEADAIGRRIDGRGVGAQAFGIYGKIRDVDRVLAARPELQERVREVHPEVCFWAWNGRKAMVHHKKTAKGEEERRKLIEKVFGAQIIGEICGSYRRGVVGIDDIHDAFAALWTAEGILKGEAEAMPNSSPRDGMGLDMRIWY